MLEKSEKLRAVTRGTWRDSSEHKVMLEEWDAETVGRLLEWLYTGDYESPLPTAEASHPKGQEARVSEGTAPMWTTYERPPKEAESGSNPSLTCLKDIRFKNDESKFTPSHAETFKLWAAMLREDDVIVDCEATLFAHAKLYVLADYMLLPALQAQVFQRLKAVLIYMNPSSDIFQPDFDYYCDHVVNFQLIRPIITLGEYVYANTIRPESGEEPLRKLISTFMALNYDLFDDEGVMQAFLGQAGEFQDDVQEKVRRLVFALKQEMKVLRGRRDGWGPDGGPWRPVGHMYRYPSGEWPAEFGC